MLRQREIINNFYDIISQHHVAQPQVISISTGTVKEPLLITLKKKRLFTNNNKFGSKHDFSS